jgi:hypothetical protein
MRKRKRAVVNQMKIRSAITNGRYLFTDVDHRTKAMRRLRDLLAAHVSDLGGDDNITEAMRGLVRRASVLTLQAEMMEQRWASNGGQASAAELETYQRCTNTMRRCCESLGLNAGRKMRELNPADDPAWKAYEREMRAP